MYMPYTTHPKIPFVRRDAVRLVCYRGWSIRKVARHFGVEPSTVSRWVRLDPTGGWRVIPTRSSRPHHHPNELSQDIINRILAIRAEKDQCAEIIHWRLAKERIFISISSVKRTLRRRGISKYSKWKKWHQYPPRPMPEKPGLLVEIDAVHEGPPGNRVSAYALIDVHSRWAYAEPSLRINTWSTITFLKQARIRAPFAFQTIQTDHGSEFSKQLTKVVAHAGISHRHSRVRTPTDNGHVERFIRTLQDECLHKIPREFKIWQKEIPKFLDYYNTKRPHMGLKMKTPTEVLRSY
jgi:transposase InsO family protein